MLTSKISSSVVMLVMLLALHPKVSFGQANKVNSSVFKIEVNKPDVVMPSEIFDLEIIVNNPGDNSMSANVKLMMPQGFLLSQPDDAHYKIAHIGNEYSVHIEKQPDGKPFTVILKIWVGNVSPALYPLFGTISFKGTSIAFNEILAVSSNNNMEPDEPEQKSENGITLTYEQTETAKAGQDFRFITTIKKTVDHSYSGKIKHRFVKGFVPLLSQISGCDFEVNGSEATISWQKMALGDEVTISYFVNVGQIPGGVYPVLTSYSDESGFTLEKNFGISVENKKSLGVVSQAIADDPIYKLSLDFPREVFPNEKFTTTVLIQKGKNTGPGTIEINVPPDFRIEAPEQLNSKFYPSTGKMIVSWSAMPANPVFEMPLTITSSNLHLAVYPVNASFIVDGKVLAEYFTHLYISHTKTPAHTVKTFSEKPLEIPEIDTTSIFSKIDNLLNEWKSATNNTPTNKSKPRQDSLQTKIVKTEKPATENGNILPPVEEIKKVKFFYGVQIKASHVKLTNLEHILSAAGIDQPLNENADGEWFRYTLGEFSTLQEAKNYLIIVKSKGFTDAFVAEFLNGKRGRIH